MNNSISFRQNAANSHGDVYRSSAIFYIPRTDTTRTTISFLNYWSLKRGIEVAVIISTRLMDGSLRKRERVKFEKGQVFNFAIDVDETFEGSVEVEVFSTEDIAVPYAAIVAWYETAQGLSVVHSYARTYSLHEIEEGHTYSRGHEGCWTISDDAVTRSFCVFHNGPFSKSAQSGRLAITNIKGEKREIPLQLEAMAAYETVRVEPYTHIDSLVEFLGGYMGQAEIDFELGGSFTRMLVGNERLDRSDLQVTHSNFNYTIHTTDVVGAGGIGWMEVPALDVETTEVVVYPQSMQGEYRVTDGRSLEKTWVTGVSVSIPVTSPTTLRFSGADADADFPTRLVTGIRSSRSDKRLPNECSLGVITSLQPRKRLWWGPIRCDDRAQSKIVVHDLPQIYGGIDGDTVLCFRLFSSTNKNPIEMEFPASAINQLKAGIDVTDIWPSANMFLNGSPGYYTMFCEYGGLTAYTLTVNRHDSVCLEHGF